MTVKPNKPMYKTLRVKLDDGSEVVVKRCTLQNTQMLLELQDELLEDYARCNGAIGEIIAKEEVRTRLQTVCNLLPIVSTKEPIEYLDFEKIQDNWEQLVVLFFNGSLNDDRQLVDVTTPSKISELHFFPYVQMLQKHVEIMTEEKEKTNAKKKD
jgi:hypothetical protein